MTQQKNREWWKSTSAADDGLIVDDEDDFWTKPRQSYRDAEWLDDFDFDDFDSPDDVGSIWGRYSVSSASDAEKVANSLKVVQGFVDTFATGDLPYRVTFDESIGTAGTDFKNRQVVVSHRPLFDPTITTDEANTVLTAMAVHEASHVRYGRKTSKAVEKQYLGTVDHGRAMKVSNCLDDVRIERRFVSDYPGYRDVFAPAIAYVAAMPEAQRDTTRMNDGDIMVASVRYADHVVWTPETTVEREWWTDWSERWTRTDRTADHLAGVAEALAHVAARDEERAEAQKQQAQKSESGTPAPQGDATSEDDGQGAASDSTQTPSESGSQPGEADQTSGSQTASGGSSEQGPAQGDPFAQSQTPDAAGDVPERQSWDDSSFPVCFADEVDEVAQANGETSGMESAEAQNEVEHAKAIVSTEYGTGEVYWGPGGIAKRRLPVETIRGASSAIRAAFARSRTGHFATQRGLRSGRVDSRSLTRIASDDYRLFSQRQAPSEGRYLVWLLVDVSGSMGGHPVQAATAVAGALATASRNVPTLDLNIWGWTTGWNLADTTFGLVRVWSTGDPIANVGYLQSIPMGSTPDREVVAWAAKAVKKAARRDQTPVLIVASDGAGSLGTGTDGASVVEKARKSGVRVVSVAIGGGLRANYQEKVYGTGNYVEWKGSIARMAGPLGQLVARFVSGQ